MTRTTANRSSPGASRARSVLHLVILALASAVLGGAPSVHAQNIESLLEEGFYREVALCDPRAALKAYTRALASADVSPSIEARLRLRIGICHDALGEEHQAREQFKIVANRHTADLKSVRAASRYLGSVVADDPSRFMPENVLFYLELVKPGDELVHLADALQGTPFENPVDSSRAQGSISSERDDTGGSTLPTSVNWVAAYLNRSFFREVAKIRGIAYGIPAGPGFDTDDHLGVASLGGSDVLPGIVTSVLTILRPPRVGYARGLPVYRLGSRNDPRDPDRESVHLAFGGDVLVWGRPRSLVEESIERFFSRGPSLASNATFRETTAQRPGALLFAYLDSSWLTALRERSSPENRLFLDGIRPVLDLDRLGPISARITSTGLTDSLSAMIDVSVRDEPAGAFWTALSTPALDTGVLRPVPDRSVGFLALRLDRVADRWQTAKKAVLDVADVVGARHAAFLHGFAGGLSEQLESSPGKELVADLRSLVVGAIQTPIIAASQAFYIIAEFDDAEAGEKSVRDVLASLSRRFTKRIDGVVRPQAEAFQSALRKVDDVDYEIHWLEPLPVLRPAYVRIGARFVVSLSHARLADAVRAASRADPGIEKNLPSGASKVLYLRPETMLRMASLETVREDVALLFLSHVKRALIYTRESADGLGIRLEIPELTPTLRAVLTSAATIIGSRRRSFQPQDDEDGQEPERPQDPEEQR